MLVEAQPLDPSTWKGPYPQVGAGTTNGSGYTTVSLSGTAMTAVETPASTSFETDEGVLSLGVYYKNSSGTYTLSYTTPQFVGASATNPMLDQVHAVQSSGSAALVGAQFTVVAEPVNPGVWSGAAYPQVGAGTTAATTGDFAAQLTGPPALLGDPTFESASGVMNLDVTVEDSAGNQYAAFTMPMYVGTDPTVVTQYDTVPASLEVNTITPSTYQMDTADGTEFASHQAPVLPEPSSLDFASGDTLGPPKWTHFEHTYCSSTGSPGHYPSWLRLGHPFIAEAALGDLHSRDWASTAELRFLGHASTTLTQSIDVNLSNNGWLTASVGGTLSETNGHGVSAYWNVGSTGLQKGNWGHAMTTGFWFQKYYKFNCAYAPDIPKETLDVAPLSWEGDALHAGRNTQGSVSGAPGNNQNGDYNIHDSQASLWVTDRQADGAQAHIWSDTMVPGSGVAKAESAGESYTSSLGVAGYGVGISTSSETEWGTSTAEDWKVKAASQTTGGCLYGVGNSPEFDAVAYAGQPYNGYCGPKSTATTVGGDTLQWITQ